MEASNPRPRAAHPSYALARWGLEAPVREEPKVALEQPVPVLLSLPTPLPLPPIREPSLPGPTALGVRAHLPGAHAPPQSPGGVLPPRVPQLPGAQEAVRFNIRLQLPRGSRPAPQIPQRLGAEPGREGRQVTGTLVPAEL